MTDRRSGFLAELKRRKVYQVAAAYVAVGVGIAVSAPDLFAVFGLPAVAARFVVLLLVVGFPVALVLAWAYEVRPEEAMGSGAERQVPPTPAAAVPLPEIAAPPEDPRPSLAVLPFASFSEDADAEYFGLGVMEDILTRLTHVRGIRLVSRTSAMRYKAAEKTAREIAAELGVRTVLEGGVRRAGGRVRIVAQLIDGTTDEHLWAETYDRDLEDVFQVQTEVAESIAAALKAELTEAERASVQRIPTDDLEAWDLYVRAIKTFQSLMPGDLAEAQGHLREAIRLDPGFAHAWGVLAQVLTLTGLCVNEHPSELFPKIREAATKALALSARCVQAHAAMGVLKLFQDWEPKEAEAELERALALNPDDSFALDWKALLLVFTGRKAEALSTARHAMASDPLSLIGHVLLGQVLVTAGRFDEGVRALEAALEIWPGAPHLHLWLGYAYGYDNRPEEALVQYEAGAELTGHLPHFDAFHGMGLAQIGRAEEARAILRELGARSRDEYVDPYATFAIRLALDGWEAAAPYLEQMVDVRSFFLPYVLGAPRFRPLHGDPRFQAVREKVFPGVAVEA